MKLLADRSPYYPFPSRPGDESRWFEMNFVNEQSPSLSPEIIQNVIEFEHQLYDLSLDPESFPISQQVRNDKETAAIPIKPIGVVQKIPITTVELGISYLMSSTGRDALEDATGIRVEAESREDFIQELFSLDISNIDSSVLDQITATSIGYEEQTITDTFIKNGFRAEGTDTPCIVTMYKNPAKLLEKTRNYKALKTYLIAVKKDLQNSQENLNSEEIEAKLFVTDLYQKRVDRFLAGMYVNAYKFLHQAKTSGSEYYEFIVGELKKELPAFSDRLSQQNIATFLQRIDRYRYGVGLDQNGKYTWNNAKIVDFVETAKLEPQKETEVDRGLYSDIEPSKLTENKISAQEFRTWISLVLNEYGILSEYEEWDSERTGTAPDNLWQVVVDGKFKSLAVDDKQKVVCIPDENRDIADAVAIGSHEIEHVIQGQNKTAVGKLALMQTIGIDEVMDQTESGAKRQEKIAFGVLNGYMSDKIAGVGYFKILEVKSRGGSFGECVETFYNNLVAEYPEKPVHELAKRAVNRVRRIYRYGGLEYAEESPIITNSQPLNYLEGEVIQSIIPEDCQYLLAIGKISLSNLSKLSEIGLVDLEKVVIPKRTPWDIMYPNVKERLSK
ncbi:MAG: hypothetical protein U0451_03635 [Candidatus Saccharimonadales bacterium]